LKTCADCHEVKPLDAFYRVKGYRDGIMSRCKHCHKIRCQQTPLEVRNFRSRRWKENHLEEVREYSRKAARRWRRENPRLNYERKQAYRAQLRQNGGSHTPEEWRALKRQFRFRCVCCGKRKPLTKDHIKPVRRGGGDEITNIQPLCHQCNSRKGAQTISYLNV
jgi:5-methylcytosine-specific restriction endonuclease McrA